MNIVERSKEVMLQVGASPIMYLMIGLSVISVAIVIERAWFFATHSENLERFAKALARHLASGELDKALQMVTASRTVESAIVHAGLQQFERGKEAVAEAMAGATAIQRMRLERRLSFLGTLGNNAPFVGLLGTVIGIVQAFDKLQSATASGGGSEVMGAIAEALVATAIGLAVAIPAVAAFNAFQRQIKSTLGNCEALTHILLTHLAARSPAQTQVCPVVDPQASEPKSRRTTGTPSSQRFEQPALGV